MTGNTGRAPGRGPIVVLDHVLIPVLDLERDAAAFARKHGLEVIAGGRHPHVGTANQLVPLGSTYLELIAVVDEAEAATLERSQRVLRAARAGRPFATWAARTDDLDALRATLAGEGWELPPAGPGARRRPDGVLLEWRTQELTAGAAPSVLPFVIEWHVPLGAHPAQAPAGHASGAGDVTRLHLTARDPAAAGDRLRAVVADGVDFDVVAGDVDELVAIELAGPSGPIRIG